MILLALYVTNIQKNKKKCLISCKIKTDVDDSSSTITF